VNHSAFVLVNGTPVDHLSGSTPAEWQAWIWAHIAPYLPLAWQIVTVLLALAATVISWRLAKRAFQALTARAKANSLEDNLTIVGAVIASGVSATGMWKFFGDVLDLPWPLRLVLFAFIEIAIVTSAVRARRNMLENYSAGVDGIAVWALTALTSVLSSMDSYSLAEAVFRLAAPLVAAWLWERGMRLKRNRLRGTTGINWRITPERVMVWLGLAEARDRTASEVDTHRRLKRVALAAKRAYQLQQADAKARKVAAALKRRDLMLDKAVEHTDLATNPTTQAVLLDLVTALGGADALSALLGEAKAPWSLLDHPAVTGAARHSEAAQLAEETRKLTEAVLSKRDPEAAATIAMLAAMLTDRRIPPPGTGTGEQVPPSVADLVAGRVALHAVPKPSNDTRTDTAADTLSDTTPKVSDEVPDEVSDDEVNEIIARLRNEEGDTGDDTATATPSATQAMRRYWEESIARGHLPSGVELAEAGGCVDSYGRRMRREWLDAMDGRTRRSLLGPKKVTA